MGYDIRIEIESASRERVDDEQGYLIYTRSDQPLPPVRANAEWRVITMCPSFQDHHFLSELHSLLERRDPNQLEESGDRSCVPQVGTITVDVEDLLVMGCYQPSVRAFLVFVAIIAGRDLHEAYRAKISWY